MTLLRECSQAASLAVGLASLACGGADTSARPSPTPVATATPTAGIPRDGLRAEWLFNGDAEDSSGNGHDGTIVGAVLAPDRSGQPNAAYSFNRAYIHGAADGLPTAERTLSLWFNARNLDRPTLFAYGGGACGTSWWIGINHGDEAQNAIQFQGHCRAHRLLYPYTEAPIGRWHHLALTTAPNGTKMYFDSALVASNSIFVNDTDVLGRDFAIGANVAPDGSAPYEDGNVTFLNGTLDDIRLYDRALSVEETLALFQEGAR